MPRAGLAPAAIVTAGAALADEIGFANLTMALLADHIGVRTPSLYKHIPSLYALKHAIANQARHDLEAALTRAVTGRAGAAAIHAFATAYREWVLAHPGRYTAPTEEGPLVLSIDAARALRSALHGFAALESAGGFGLPRDIDRSYHLLVEALINTLHREGPP